MNLINNNPYRILGLPLTATEREIAKQINTLATYAEMGKTKSFDTDFLFLSAIDRTPDAIEEAKKQIEQSESKLLYSLFWFWKNNSADELALELLKEGNINKAIAIWEKSVFANKNKVYKPVVLFENLINQSSNWSEEDNEDHSLKKEEDEYTIERKAGTGSSIPVVYADINDDENWTIDCDTEWLDGIDNNSYGIIFGRNIGSYFSFNLSGNGYYCCGRDTETTYDKLIDWKECISIRKWSNNHIQIKKINDTVIFYINNEFVDSITYEPLFGKNFGFKITNMQKVSFRNFKFCKLVEQEIYGEGINVSSKNFSNIKNLSTLFLSLATNNRTVQLEYFKKGIALAENFFTSENIEDYSKLIAGEKYIYNPEKVLHFYINNILDFVKAFLDKTEGITTSELVNSFATFPVEVKQLLNKRFVEKQLQNIDKEIEVAKTERQNLPANATNAGKDLVRNTKADIIFLKSILGETDFQFQIIGDKLSQAIVQCGIDAYNYSKDAKGEIDYAKAIKSEESYLSEYEYALTIAVTVRAKERAKENLDSCNQNIKNKHFYYCWFCENGTPEESCKFEKTLYEITNRDYQGVKYKYVSINIPRCPNCKNFHKFQFDFESVSGQTFGAGIAGLMFGYVSDILTYLVGNTYCFVGKLITGNFNSIKSNIKDTNHFTLTKYPLIHERIKQGWQLEKPEA